MNNIRLIATDLDGTLLDGRGGGGNISEYTKETIRECMRRGITFMAVSGRCYETARKPAVDAGLDFMIASSNGARIDKTPNGPVIYERAMSEAECTPVFEALKDCTGQVNVYIRGTNFVKDKDGTDMTERDVWDGAADRPLRWAHMPLEEIRKIVHGGVHKFEVYDSDTAVLIKYDDILTRLGLLVTSSNPMDIEIQPQDSSKGAAVTFMAKQLGITKDQIMCFGDYTNDTSLIKAAGFGFAMENAVDALKAETTYIAPPNYEDGEARMIRKIAFGEDVD